MSLWFTWYITYHASICVSDVVADAGKSTTGGQILFLSGQVDDRTIQKYEKEAKDKSRESWWDIILLSNLTFWKLCSIVVIFYAWRSDAILLLCHVCALLSAEYVIQ